MRAPGPPNPALDVAQGPPHPKTSFNRVQKHRGWVLVSLNGHRLVIGINQRGSQLPQLKTEGGWRNKPVTKPQTGRLKSS